MKIREIKVLIEPDIYGTNFYRATIKIFIAENMNYQYGIQKIYPVDHLKSLFDMIWEDIGKELKQKLIEEDENDRSD